MEQWGVLLTGNLFRDMVSPFACLTTAEMYAVELTERSGPAKDFSVSLCI